MRGIVMLHALAFLASCVNFSDSQAARSERFSLTHRGMPLVFLAWQVDPNGHTVRPGSGGDARNCDAVSGKCTAANEQ
jgi:hypothetical protein